MASYRCMQSKYHVALICIVILSFQLRFGCISDYSGVLMIHLHKFYAMKTTTAFLLIASGNDVIKFRTAYTGVKISRPFNIQTQNINSNTHNRDLDRKL